MAIEFHKHENKLTEIADPHQRWFAERVARGITFEHDNAKISVTSISANEQGGFARFVVTPGVSIMMLPKYDHAHFVVSNRTGSLEPMQSGLHTAPITVINTTVVVPASTIFSLTIEHDVCGVVCWVEKPFLEHWRSILGLENVQIDQILTDVTEREFVNLIRSWEACIESGNSADDKAVLEAFPSLIANYILGLYRAENNRTRSAQTEKDITDTFMIIIAENVSKNISMSTIAKKINISQKKLTNIIKKETGSTPYQHVLKARLKLVHELLSNSDKTLSDVAYSAGFSSQAHLTTLLKRVTGKPPGRYRVSEK